jgi:anti-sigma factor RsiW
MEPFLPAKRVTTEGQDKTMNCTLINEQLDDYLDGELTPDQANLFDRHLGECAPCLRNLDEQRALQTRLRDYGASNMPQPDAAFFDLAMARATRNGSRKQRNRWVMTGFGGAMAAALAIWMIGGVFFSAPQVDDAAVPGVTMALEEPRTLNLIFSSAVALADATMTVMLPQGIEIEGFEGQREITWMTSLREGRNVLPLTLIATGSQGGELLATLRHEDDDRSFRVQVTII